MKAGTAAFWLFIILVAIAAIVVIFAIVFPSDGNAEIIESFLGIIKFVLTLVGGGYLGIQIERHSKTGGDEE